jgi:hypothetical protein
MASLFRFARAVEDGFEVVAVGVTVREVAT